ncbi:DUF6415 family natural product biosynthesis protein [Streptomyces luteireticuli]|uniref:Uncharacterized protein n=1 Tax=Streptomyces luteireticuli TaxID=173858 RepID=A0ABN0YZC5_9ACTN
MPVFPRTGMTEGGLIAEPQHHQGEPEITGVVRLYTSMSRIMPPHSQTMDSIARLRTFITEAAPKIAVAAYQLPEGHHEREVTLRVAKEAIRQCKELGPGDGYRSAFTYCRTLAQSADKLLTHLLPSAHAVHVVTERTAPPEPGRANGMVSAPRPPARPR